MDQETEAEKQQSENQHQQEDDQEGTTNAQAGAGTDAATNGGEALGHADDTGSASDDEEDDTQEDEETEQAAQDIAADALPSPSNGGSVDVLPWPKPFDNDSNNAVEVLDEREASIQLDRAQLSGCTNAEVLGCVEQHQQVLVRTVTWNLQGKPPPKPSDIQAKLLPANKFHVYVIGSEECERSIASSAVNPSKKVWESFLKGLIGENYTAICSHTLQAIHSIAFVHNALLPVVSSVRTMAVATGVANKLGNKGAVALSFAVGNTSLLFINAHLAAHQNKVKARNTQYHRIMEAIAQAWCGNDEAQPADETAARPKAETKAQDSEAASARISAASVLEAFDRVVFAGDLNYRIRGNRRIVDKLIHNGMQEVLLANDQLLSSVAQKLAFEGFAEGPLNFLPTYKLQRGGDLYDPGPKRRIPAWTDRVLYKPSGCQLLTYNSEPSLKSSDHRPVYASLLMDVQLSSREGATEGKEDYNADFVTTSEICAVM